MTRIWLVNWHFQSRITLWCRHKSTNVSMGLCWQMPKFIVWRLWSIYFDHHLPLKPSIGKRHIILYIILYYILLLLLLLLLLLRTYYRNIFCSFFLVRVVSWQVVIDPWSAQNVPRCHPICTKDLRTCSSFGSASRIGTIPFSLV